MEQYKKLQHTWKGSGLPIDLFYKKGQEHIVTKKQSILSKALNIFGFTSKSSKIYTPKQWEIEISRETRNNK